MKLLKGDTTHSPKIINGLTRLKLDYSWIDEEAVSELVIRFPNLKQLCIMNCIFSNSNSNSANNAAKIIMPDISLDVLALFWSGGYTGTWNNQYSKAILKISTSSMTDGGHNKKRIQHFGLDGSEMKTITEEEYEMETKADTIGCLSYEITCRYIRTVIIKLNDLFLAIPTGIDQ